MYVFKASVLLYLTIWNFARCLTDSTFQLGGGCSNLAEGVALPVDGFQESGVRVEGQVIKNLTDFEMMARALVWTSAGLTRKL